jgi:hypothetical protein
MSKLIYINETSGCRATIELDSKEICMVSVAQAGVVVRAYRAKEFIRSLVGSYFGPVLFNEENVDAAAKTAAVLDTRFPGQNADLAFRTPILLAFANAIWHCSNAPEVMLILNDARQAQQERQPPATRR